MFSAAIQRVWSVSVSPSVTWSNARWNRRTSACTSSFVVSHDVTASDMPLAWRVVGDSDFCVVGTVSLCVSWFFSGAFEYVWTVLIYVTLFTNSLSSHSTVQTLSLISKHFLFFHNDTHNYKITGILKQLKFRRPSDMFLFTQEPSSGSHFCA
jgi:hypothetical protein